MDSVHANAVLTEVRKLGGRPFRLNLGSAAHTLELALRLGPDRVHSGSLQFLDSGLELALNDVDSVFYHQVSPVEAHSSVTEPGAREAAQGETASALQAMFRLSTAPWINDYEAGRRSQGKLLQQEAAIAEGLRTPDTLVTNDPRALLELAERHGQLAIKYLHRAHFKVKDWPYFHFTRRVGPEAIESRRSQIRRCPVFAQEYIEKAYEVRATVVGEQVFACRIDSQVDAEGVVDWRMADDTRLPHTAIELPDVIEDALLRVHRRLGLFFGAADLAVTPEGEHVFLETNSGGAWLWVEERTGQPITRAVASALVNPQSIRSRMDPREGQRAE